MTINEQGEYIRKVILENLKDKSFLCEVVYRPFNLLSLNPRPEGFVFYLYKKPNLLLGFQFEKGFPSKRKIIRSCNRVERILKKAEKGG